MAACRGSRAGPTRQGALAESPPPDASGRAASAWRAWFVACQAATILLTWELWQHRAPNAAFPTLPAWDALAGVSFGATLLASLVVVLWRPVWGAALHVALIVAACAFDQNRIQPTIVSQGFLLVGTLPRAWAPVVVRAHLTATWLWAGIHKLASPAYGDGAGAVLFERIFTDLSHSAAQTMALALALGEISLGLATLLPRMRRLVPWAAAALHLGALASLSPLGIDWNRAVWPWNAALATAGLAYFGRRGALPLLATLAPGRARQALRATVAALLLSPALYYVGAIDAYLAHCLYSANVPQAWRIPADGRPQPGDVPVNYAQMQVLGAPMPPELRLFRAWVAKAPRETLLFIEDPRPLAAQGHETRWLTPDGELGPGGPAGAGRAAPTR